MSNPLLAWVDMDFMLPKKPEGATGVTVFTNPGSCFYNGAGWDHPALTVWQHAMVAWDRDFPDHAISGIYVHNGERHPHLWIGLVKAIPKARTVYGEHRGNSPTTNVVQWCAQCRHWEATSSERDHRGWAMWANHFRQEITPKLIWMGLLMHQMSLS